MTTNNMNIDNETDYTQPYHNKRNSIQINKYIGIENHHFQVLSNPHNYLISIKSNKEEEYASEDINKDHNYYFFKQAIISNYSVIKILSYLSNNSIVNMMYLTLSVTQYDCDNNSENYINYNSKNDAYNNSNNNNNNFSFKNNYENLNCLKEDKNKYFDEKNELDYQEGINHLSIKRIAAFHGVNDFLKKIKYNIINISKNYDINASNSKHIRIKSHVSIHQNNNSLYKDISSKKINIHNKNNSNELELSNINYLINEASINNTNNTKNTNGNNNCDISRKSMNKFSLNIAERLGEDGGFKRISIFEPNCHENTNSNNIKNSNLFFEFSKIHKTGFYNRNTIIYGKENTRSTITKNSHNNILNRYSINNKQDYRLPNKCNSRSYISSPNHIKNYIINNSNLEKNDNSNNDNYKFSLNMEEKDFKKIEDKEVSENNDVTREKENQNKNESDEEGNEENDQKYIEALKHNNILNNFANYIEKSHEHHNDNEDKGKDKDINKKDYSHDDKNENEEIDAEKGDDKKDEEFEDEFSSIANCNIGNNEFNNNKLEAVNKTNRKNKMENDTENKLRNIKQKLIVKPKFNNINQSDDIYINKESEYINIEKASEKCQIEYDKEDVDNNNYNISENQNSRNSAILGQLNNINNKNSNTSNLSKKKKNKRNKNKNPHIAENKEIENHQFLVEDSQKVEIEVQFDSIKSNPSMEIDISKEKEDEYLAHIIKEEEIHNNNKDNIDKVDNFNKKERLDNKKSKDQTSQIDIKKEKSKNNSDSNNSRTSHNIIKDSFTHSSVVQNESLKTSSNNNQIKNSKSNIIYSVKCKAHGTKYLKISQNSPHLNPIIICTKCNSNLLLSENKSQKLKKKPKLKCDFDSQEALFFCIDCDKFICKACFAKQHKLHRSNLITNTASKIFEENNNRIKIVSVLKEKVVSALNLMGSIGNKIIALKKGDDDEIRNVFDYIFEKYKKFFISVEESFYIEILRYLDKSDNEGNSNRASGNFGNYGIIDRNNYRNTIGSFKSSNDRNSSLDNFFSKMLMKLSSINELNSRVDKLKYNLQLSSFEELKKTNNEIKLLLDEISVNLNRESNENNNIKLDSKTDSQLKYIITNYNTNKYLIENLNQEVKIELNNSSLSAKVLFNTSVNPMTYTIRRFDSFSKSKQENLSFFKKTGIAIVSKSSIYIKGIGICGINISEKNRIKCISGELDPLSLAIPIEVEVKEILKKYNNKAATGNNNEDNDNESFNFIFNNLVSSNNNNNDTHVDNSDHTASEDSTYFSLSFKEKSLFKKRGFLKPILNTVSPVFTFHFDTPVNCGNALNKNKKVIVISITNKSSEEYLNLYSGSVSRLSKNINTKLQTILYESNNNDEEISKTNLSIDFAKNNEFIIFSSKSTESDFIETEKGIICDILYSKQ